MLSQGTSRFEDRREATRMNAMSAFLHRLLHDERFTRLILPVLSGIYTFLYVSVPLPQPAWALNVPQMAWKVVIGCIGLLCSVLLYWSRTHPFAIITIQAVLYIVLSLVTLDESFLIPLMAALFSCVYRSPAPQAIAGVFDAAAAISAVTLLLHRHDMLIIEWSARMALVAAVTAAALAARSYRTWKETQRRERQEQERAEILMRERDQAMSRATIAAELHDSVGHDLTTIIALSEGFAGSQDIGEIHGVLHDINQVARDGLHDTRQAVHALSQNGETHDDNNVESGAPCTNGAWEYGAAPHQWNEIDPVLEHARSIGLAVAHTETGRRPEDPEQADLCFVISREAITNVLRHASSPSTIIVAWDHHPDGSVHVSIHDDGDTSMGDTIVPANPRSAEIDTPKANDSGTGLRQLARRCAAAGARLHYGPADTGGWAVEATIPATTHASRHASEQGTHTEPQHSPNSLNSLNSGATHD